MIKLITMSLMARADFQKLKRSLINVKRQAQNNKPDKIKTRSE